MKRHANATWQGNLKEGKGIFSTDHGGIRDVSYTWSTRFGDAAGTNPEELIAAAHASCFSMALSGELGKANLTPERLDTRATVTMEKTDAGNSVTQIHLAVTGKVPGATPDAFRQAAEAAKKGCPISRLLSPGAKVTMDANLG